MFHTLMTLTTTATVVLHALLGCCVHHAHAGQTLSRCVETVTASIEHPGCDGHSHHCRLDGVAAAADPCQGISTHATSCETLHCDLPCSGSHGSHESCDEPDCLIVADQRSHHREITTWVVCWSLLTDSLRLSWRDAFTLPTQLDPPPDFCGLRCPLRIEQQVWRL